jgi:hypothetical protein
MVLSDIVKGRTQASTLTRVHWDLPETRQLGLAIANVRNGSAVVRHSIVQRVRPESVRVGVRDRDSRGSRGVVSELQLGEHFERVARVVEVWRSETPDLADWDTGQRVQRNDVSSDLFSV